jgi:hypothetical protein
MKKTTPGMTTRRLTLLGLAALGLTVGAPVHARHDFSDGPFVVAKRDRDEEARRDRRDEGREVRRDRREAESEEPRGYGYGYERRQQQRDEEDERRRGR